MRTFATLLQVAAEDLPPGVRLFEDPILTEFPGRTASYIAGVYIPPVNVDSTCLDDIKLSVATFEVNAALMFSEVRDRMLLAAAQVLAFHKGRGQA